ncbi:hypothetical protein pdam_00007590, partial [Pocillopora damicornis]
ILITVINNDVVFISESCDSSDLNSSTNYHERLDRGVQTPLLSAMAGLQTRHFLKAFTLFSLLFLYNCSAKLNVFLEAKEVSRFLYDLKTNLYLVRDGIVAPVLKTPILSGMIPPIDHRIKDLKFRFNGTKKVQYSLNFKSSNETIMRHPTTNIRLTGLVPRKTKGKNFSDLLQRYTPTVRNLFS